MWKHTRPFACPEQDCHVKSFSDKAGLQRHCREVHGHDENGLSVQRYRCPEKNCKRNRRGFSRQSNMIEHYRKIHGGSSSKADTVLSSGDLADPSDLAEIPENTMAKYTGSLVPDCSAPSPPENILGTALEGGLRQHLEAELRKLRQKKNSVNAQLDMNIEGVLTILASVKEEVQGSGV